MMSPTELLDDTLLRSKISVSLSYSSLSHDYQTRTKLAPSLEQIHSGYLSGRAAEVLVFPFVFTTGVTLSRESIPVVARSSDA